MIIVIGLVIVIAAVLVGVAHVLGNSSIRHAFTPLASALTAFVMISALAGFPGAASAGVRTAGEAAAGHGHGSGEGTVAARSRSRARTTVKHAAASASLTATGALSTVVSETVNGGYTAAGIGMRNLGYGMISITGVPPGAAVKSATLLWDVLANQADPTLAQGTFNGNLISGTEWASGTSPCWPVSSNFSYEADVTSLVTGNGSYALAGFATGQNDGADPWNVGSAAPLLEGASLVVVYQLASMPQTAIQIAEGATETDSGNAAAATLGGFTASAHPSATTTYIVADGQEAGNTAAFNGTTLPGVSFPGADPQAVPNYSQGNLWDTVTADVSSLVSPGDTSASLAVTGYGDCLVWVGQVLASAVSALTITTSSLPDGTMGHSYSYALNATGGTPPYTWSLTSGSLPPELKLSPAGIISGKPRATSTYGFTVKVNDATTPTAETATASFSITDAPSHHPWIMLVAHPPAPVTGCPFPTSSFTATGEGWLPGEKVDIYLDTAAGANFIATTTAANSTFVTQCIVDFGPALNMPGDSEFFQKSKSYPAEDFPVVGHGKRG